jgi:Nuclease A inhibitor-like protein
MQDQINQLTELTKDLFYISESDALWQVHPLKTDEPVMEQLVTIANQPPSVEVEVRDWQQFLQHATTVQDWMSDDEKATVARYQALKTYVDTTLTDVQVYRLGTVEISVFVVGTTANCDIIALATQAVET